MMKAKRREIANCKLGLGKDDQVRDGALLSTLYSLLSTSRGLTLIEVVLAVAILSVGFTVLLTGASRCLAVMKIARNYQTAQWTLGMGQLDYPLIVTDDVEDLEVEPFIYPNGFTYSREVEDDEDEDGLFVIRTRISWSDRGRESYEEIVRYVLQMENP